MSLLCEKYGDGETAATGPPPDVPLTADPVPDDPVADDPVPGARHIRRAGPKQPGPPAPRPANDERTDGQRARRLLANLIMLPVIAVVGLGLVLSPLLMVAAGVALPIWSSGSFDATHGTFVAGSCQYRKATINGERSAFSECTGRFVADDGSLLVERTTFERSGTIEVGDRSSAWITEDFGVDRALADGEYRLGVFGAASMWVLGAFLIPGGFWLGYRMLGPRRAIPKRMPVKFW